VACIHQPTPPPSAHYTCTVCAHVYDPATDYSPAPPGTHFEDLPASWVCPVCGAPKSAYKKEGAGLVEGPEGESVWGEGESVWVHLHDDDER
jgi:rubredoxin